MANTHSQYGSGNSTPRLVLFGIKNWFLLYDFLRNGGVRFMSSWPYVFVFSLLMFPPLFCQGFYPEKVCGFFLGWGVASGLPHFVDGFTQIFFVHIRVYTREQPLVSQMNARIC